MTVDAKIVGEQIYALRKTKGLTQNELGERLSISAQAVSKWERGSGCPDRHTSAYFQLVFQKLPRPSASLIYL